MTRLNSGKSVMITSKELAKVLGDLEQGTILTIDMEYGDFKEKPLTEPEERKEDIQS